MLPIGYFYGSTGPIRPEGNLQWNAQPAILWGYEIATKGSSAYKTFADGNADGIIDLADQAAIGFNLTKNVLKATFFGLNCILYVNVFKKLYFWKLKKTKNYIYVNLET